MALDPGTIEQGLIARGLPPIAARAFAAEAGSESGFDPAINERAPLVPGSRGGFGLWQHTGPRRKQLEAFARDRGTTPDDPDTQMDFLAWELQNTEANAAPRILGADTVEGARAAIITDFLRPAPENRDKRLAELGVTRNDASPQVPQAVLDAYDAGTLTPEQMSVVDRAREAGLIPAPSPTRSVIDAYNAGTLTPEQMATVERAAERGLVDLSQGQPPERSMLQSALRGLGLGTRAVAQGAAGLADILYAPSAEVAGLATGQVSPPLRAQVSEYLTSLGVPEPETATERVLQAAQEAATGAAGGVGAARAVGGLVSGPVARGAAELAGALPGAQVASGLGAGAAQQGAAEMGAGPVGQTLAGLGGAVAGGLAPGAARRAVPAVDDATGAVVARAEPPLTSQPQRTAGPAAVAGPPAARATAPAASQAELGRLIRRAAQGSSQAREELARVIDTDPRAAEAAAVLDIDMPADVWARNLEVREAAGGLRGLLGTEAKMEFESAVRDAALRADDIMREVVGARSISVVSQDVLDSLQNTQATLKNQAGQLYKAVDSVVPAATPVTPANAIRLIGEEITASGGVGNVNKATREVFRRITDPDNTLTYKALSDLKSDLGRALKNQGPYADANTATIKRLYGALRADQLEAAGAIGGTDARAALRTANQITAKQKALEDRIVKAFGEDLDGSIAKKLQTAVQQGAEKGDLGNLNRIMKTIPKDLRGDTVAAALGKLSEKITAGERGFGFNEFTRLYSGLRQQPGAYKIVADAVGPEGERMMQALYEVSRKISDASNRISRTGASTQPVIQEIVAQGIVERVASSGAMRSATQGAAIGGGAVTGGVAGAAAGGLLEGVLMSSKGSNAQRTIGLLKDPAFQELVAKAATRPVTPKEIGAVTKTPAFRRWADSQGFGAEWFQGAVQAIQGAHDNDQR